MKQPSSDPDGSAILCLIGFIVCMFAQRLPVPQCLFLSLAGALTLGWHLNRLVQLAERAPLPRKRRYA